MPVITPPSSSIFDTVNSVLNAARVRLNDRLPTLVATGGKILDTEDAFSQQVANNAWRWLQEELADLGSTKYKQEVVLTGIPAMTNQDPNAKQFVNWNTFFDGTNYLTQPRAWKPIALLLPTRKQ